LIAIDVVGSVAFGKRDAMRAFWQMQVFHIGQSIDNDSPLFPHNVHCNWDIVGL
jgi:hypothetical protein